MSKPGGDSDHPIAASSFLAADPAMNRLGLLVLLVFSACTAPRPAAKPDTVRTGEATAKDAADAARKAEADGTTGLIVATSGSAVDEDPEPTTQPTAPPEQSPAVRSEIDLHFVRGVVTMHGEPVSDLGKVAADAVAANPDVVFLFTSTEPFDPAKVEEVTATTKAAGVKQVKFLLVTQLDAAAEE